MSGSRWIWALALLLTTAGASAATATFNGTSSNNFSDVTIGNWTGGSGPSGNPAAGDYIIINHDCTVDVTPVLVFGNLTIENGKTLTFANGVSLSVGGVSSTTSGTLTLGTGTLVVSGTLDVTN